MQNIHNIRTSRIIRSAALLRLAAWIGGVYMQMMSD